MDPLALLWVLIITGVGFLIHLYSIGYMDGRRAFARFFAYMNFFVFAMLTLVLSDNFVGLLVGWGLVGLASYFLIGFWFFKPSAVAAARKAFVINVVGDVGIMFAILLIFNAVHSVGFGDAFAAAGSVRHAAAPGICIALFIGAAAKSAQIPLHTWLPDAMEGPTPVSALIHAATMVTAGVYLVARCAPLWSANGDAQLLVGTIGGATALIGAILGCAQWDIKRILAYSTMSQIGYMIMGVGVGAYEGGVAHFFTHAFFKAQLFLAAGRSSTRSQRTRRSPDGRSDQEAALRVRCDSDGRSIDLRNARFQRILFQRQSDLRRAGNGSSVALCGRYHYRRDHRVLHVPLALRYVLRNVSRRRRSVGPRHSPSGTGRNAGRARRARIAPPRAGVDHGGTRRDPHRPDRPCRLADVRRQRVPVGEVLQRDVRSGCTRSCRRSPN